MCEQPFDEGPRSQVHASPAPSAIPTPVDGAQHPDRDAQFHHINDKAKECIGHGVPVISVDTEKKELVGNFKNGGREWQRF